MPATLIAITIAALGTTMLVRLILSELDAFTGDVALDQAYEGAEPV